MTLFMDGRQNPRRDGHFGVVIPICLSPDHLARSIDACFSGTLIFLHGVGDSGDNWLRRLRDEPGLRDFKVPYTPFSRS